MKAHAKLNILQIYLLLFGSDTVKIKGKEFGLGLSAVVDNGIK